MLIEVASGRSCFAFDESDPQTVTGLLKEGNYYRKLYIPDGVKTIAPEAFKRTGLCWVMLPDGLEKICEGAFRDSTVKKIYIPASVKVIENGAFSGCGKVKIYCEGSPQEGWLDGTPFEEDYYEDMTDAFNFHRSGGSFDDCYLVRRTRINHNSYNPEKRPVLEKITRKRFEKLQAY